MEFETFLNKDISVHTINHKYRGILLTVLKGVLHLKPGIDEFYIETNKVVAITVHGREIGKESVE